MGKIIAYCMECGSENLEFQNEQLLICKGCGETIYIKDLDLGLCTFQYKYSLEDFKWIPTTLLDDVYIHSDLNQYLSVFKKEPKLKEELPKIDLEDLAKQIDIISKIKIEEYIENISKCKEEI